VDYFEKPSRAPIPAPPSCAWRGFGRVSTTTTTTTPQRADARRRGSIAPPGALDQPRRSKRHTRSRTGSRTRNLIRASRCATPDSPCAADEGRAHQEGNGLRLRASEQVPEARSLGRREEEKAIMSIAATPIKLASGAWGARTRHDVAIGDVVTITTAAGKTWTATVTAIVSLRDGVTVVSTRSTTPCPAARPAERGYGAARGGRRACKSDGNCSSFGSGRSCGGHDCDGY